MSLKSKRVIYSDSDCHTLVDIVIKYKNIVECKKTDAVTWKEKVTAWEKIAETYNSASIEPRTPEQLRCKFDNLKKQVLKYEAQRRQSMFKTGGGIDHVDIKAAIKLLYDKIKSIISFSVRGLEPAEGDSDLYMTASSMMKDLQHVEVVFHEDVSPSMSQVFQIPGSGKGQSNYEDAVIDEKQNYNDPIASQPLKVLEIENGQSHYEQAVIDEKQNRNNPIASQPLKVLEIENDWSDYTPRKLQSRKHKVLQTKRKRTSGDNENTNLKEDHLLLKKRLLEEEAERNKDYHEKRNRREEELHLHKMKQLELQNKKLELEIEILKKQLSNSC